ncbi:hypothetical protein A2303_00970 [Candidatus Falkowbacteria bacterium RIFOXYB2_FULL_47_14]|uniref:Glycoside hydrolase family 57 N-terminal domain-containing protein n=1 Tax=Candidatus Falkowbacteria bacterium RIFOXYA2_FULL_47_19 TaxID=1797994 RepID=A0A1F5SG21_9BACT|nr:MAG: hypothetical protein A2227_00170 [Candidatus Falkowbacteria bacterium RIFOXYA2_FULL_47_19]OGF35579.1 MAG: hypothetical protein A2468_06105 [Candidatus Falkowbacteria bacterium RIFOXYC2_FULL_46_15]OGF42937.1 MAG: hypothetical protein A2303_00970 [Candidatus Falkowbacteria bacterium RIFOXYB2_FULL_47_14]
MAHKNIKLTWLNFLHLYQPVNTDEHIIKEATEMSYKRIIRALEENPAIKFTVNISGSLFIRWKDLGYGDLIVRIGKLIKRGQLELTGTACYHPIMPLIPLLEAERQVKENENLLKENFGPDFKPRGFFLPEMAYSPAVAKLVKRLGYKWLVLDELAVNGALGKVDTSRVYLDKATGLKVVVRNRKLSNSYVPETITGILAGDRKTFGDQETDIITTATDGELYGLRYIDQTGVFEKLLRHKDIITETFSGFIASHPKTETISPPLHSWETSEKELAKGEPFNLWQEKTNTVHKKLWGLAAMAYETVESFRHDKNYHWARWHLSRGLASCTFWWASAKDFRLLSPLSWSPDEIERGTNELIRSIRTLEDENSRETKIKAEKLYIAIKKMIWERHWIYYWKKT